MRNQFLVALAAALLHVSAVAANPPSFAELDADNSGDLTELELEHLEQFSGEDTEFHDADANNDDLISPVEYQAWLEEELRSESAATK